MSSTPSARSRAQSHFKSSEHREDAIRAELEKERAAVDARTARLKALRLAKEAEERVEAARLAAEKSQAKPAKRAAKR
jgi:hypothetical protein